MRTEIYEFPSLKRRQDWTLLCFSVFSNLVLTGSIDDDLALMSNTEACTFSFSPGAVTRLVQPFLRPQSGSSYVRIPVVPHSFYCQVSTLHGLPHHWLTALRGKHSRIRKPFLHPTNVSSHFISFCWSHWLFNFKMRVTELCRNHGCIGEKMFGGMWVLKLELWIASFFAKGSN